MAHHAPRIPPTLRRTPRRRWAPAIPHRAGADDESNWGASEDKSTDEEQRNLKKFRTREETRLLNVRDMPQPAPACKSAQITPGQTRGPEVDLRVARQFMAMQCPHLWSCGSRITDGSRPTADTPIGTPMHKGDLLSTRFVEFIGPARGTNPSSIHRSRFREMLLTGFSVFGLFERMVMLGQWEYTELPLEHYPFDTTNITMSQAFAWAYTHGIKPGSRAATQLHNYAQSWRNARRNLAEGNEEFGDFPRNAWDVLSVDMPFVTSWRTLTCAVPSSRDHPAANSEMPPVDNIAAPTSVTDVKAGEIVPMEVPLPESPVHNSPHLPDEDPADVTSDEGPTSMAPKTDAPA
ncbi:hypothetical protein B0H17DRAFT_1204825 [Mycena rosella]|uniref:Uncharacterized protein n=1 Tax=Mycena rosella TaxID=1033263 RepID=A0AAD7D8J5_MYCRO|nr:hypothetical protein B0H17DRAFT_1204825 [Mycena rosella]